MSKPHEIESKETSNTPKDEAYSASKHSIQGAEENVTEAKEAVGKATDSIKNLLSGDGNMVDAAVAVKGAYDNVMGLSGRISSSLMMPVLKALSAFKGQAFLPAGRQTDPVMGIDVHMVTIPPSPLPVPLPHPYIGILFNAKDWVSCALNTFKKDALDALPPPAEDDKSNMASIASNKGAIAGIAMGLAGMSASVKFGPVVPRATTGTKVKNIPHIPMGAGFHPAFDAAVAKNDGKAFLGSLFVAADGDPMTGSFHLNYDCWDIGVIDLFKAKRAGAIKEPAETSTKAELFVPSGTILPIPWGRPVLVNSIPTPINPLAILDKLFKAGLSKLKKHAVEAAINVAKNTKAGQKAGCDFWTAVSAKHGTGQSHPVDVAGGYFYTNNEDFKLRGPIPFEWVRTWQSFSNYNGPLGYGWHHSYDIALSFDLSTNTAVIRMADGRPAVFDIPTFENASYNRGEKIFLILDNDDYYCAHDKAGLIYRFTKKEYFNNYSGTQTHLLLSITNRNDFAIRFAYNTEGLLSQIIDSAGRILIISNDNKGRIVSITAPHPNLTGKTFSITNYGYSDDGDMVLQTDALSQSMRFEYSNHLLVKEVWRNGFSWQFRYNKHSGRDSKCVEVWGDGDLLHYKFDYTDSNRTVVINSLGHKKIFYHKNGLVTKYIDANGAVWKYFYGSYNERESFIDSLGNKYAYTYDQWGNSTSVTDPCGGSKYVTYQRSQFTFLPASVIDASGASWQREYDQAGNLIKLKNPAGGIVKYQYHNGLICKIVNSANATSILEYDNCLNLITLQTEDNASIRYECDFLGNLTKIINPNGVKQKRIYDIKGRLIQIHNFDGNIIHLTYDSIDNVIHYHDNQKEIDFTYWGFWKLISRRESGATINFKYNTEEQIVKIVNEHGVTYNFELDAVGNIIKETAFDGIVRYYERNKAGLVTQLSRPDGKFTKYEYDGCGRVKEVLFSDGKTEVFDYHLNGDLVSARNEVATLKFARDAMGNIIKETVNDNWVASEYDVFGNQTRVTSSLGAETKYEYNKVGDMTQMGTDCWSGKFEYDKLGLETNRSLPGNIMSQWQRDGIGRPVAHIVGQTTEKTFSRSRKKVYQWDVNDRLKQISDDVGITRFEYEGCSYLSKTIFADGEEQLRSTDAVGNLFRTANHKDRLYSNGGQLKKGNGWEYRYDGEGNLVEKKHVNGQNWKYEWSVAGRLTKVVRPDGAEVLFTYDALGRRLSKKYHNTVTKFIWDGDVPLHEWKEHEIAGEKLSDASVDKNGLITWLFEMNSFVPAAKIKGNKQYSIVTDYLGTPAQMYKEDGTLCWDYELDSYGKARMGTGELASCPFRYKGQYEDLETGLYYNRFRYYSSEEGLYLSQDPIRLAGGMSLYGYVKDVNRWVDELGLTTNAGYSYRQGTANDPGLNDFVNDLQSRGVVVTGKNLEIIDDATGRVVGEVDVLTPNAAIQYKNGGSSASALIAQIRDKTEPYVAVPVIGFVQGANGTTPAAERTIKGASNNNVLATNDPQLLADVIK